MRHIEKQTRFQCYTGPEYADRFERLCIQLQKKNKNIRITYGRALEFLLDEHRDNGQS